MALISGTAGNDTLTGTTADDTLRGELGVDIIDGGDGNDVLDSGWNVFAGQRLFSSYYGDAGGNQLRGGNGDDILTGGGGDLLDGGAGNDTITASRNVFSLGEGPVTITGGDGVDNITAGTEIYGAIDAGAGADTINLTIRYRTSAETLTVTTGAGADVIGVPGGGVARGISTVPAMIVVADFTVSGPDHDSIVRIGGGTLFDSSASNPYAIAQVGADTAVFMLQYNANDQGSTPYLLLKNVDAQTLTAANFGGFDPGPIWTIGGDGVDSLTVSAVSNRMLGFGGADVLAGGGGDDVLVGGAGADVMAGGAGADTFAFYDLSDTGVFASDEITDFQTGLDKLDFTKAQTFNVRVVTNGVDSVVYAYSPVSVTAVVHVAGIAQAVDIIAPGVSVAGGVQGTANADTLVGTTGGDIILGGASADFLTGGAGKDVFAYLAASESTAAASDKITDFQTGVDVIDLSGLTVGQVSITDTGGARIVEAHTDQGVMRIEVQGAIVDTDIWASASKTSFALVAVDGRKTLIGSGGYDQLVGGAGEDQIIGNGGGDNLTGGAGADTFLYSSTLESPSSDYDIIADFEHGVDKIDLSAVNPFAVSLVHSGGATYLFVQDAFHERLKPLTIAVAGTVQVTDVVVGPNNNFYIVGDSGGETLVGGAGLDTIVGGGGADALFGGRGSNSFTYNAASDSNAAAYDIIHDFKAGIDKLDLTGLNPSNVSIIHYQGGTFVFGGSGPTTFQIASTETIDGSDLLGLTGGVYVVGEDLGGSLIGGAKADTVVGGAGADVIRGGGSGDALFGGAGADVFVYKSVDDSRPSASGLDILHDFETGVDHLDLTGLAPSNVSIIRYNGGSFISGVSGGEVFQVASTRDVNASDIVGLTSGAYIVGDDGVNRLTGGAATESIVGGGGNDIITGGGGADALYGGAGADVFKYLATLDSSTATPDIVHDFQVGVDKIDLSAAHASASDTYGFAYASGATFLFVDLGGDGVNDMLIQLVSATVTASDLVW